MRKIITVLLFSVLTVNLFSQAKSCDKTIINKSYTYASIYGALTALIDKPSKANYFSDDFFNDLLKKIILDKKFSDKEKVQLFYLMQKKIGYAFSGVSYLAPNQNYFATHEGKVYTYQKTRLSLKSLNYDPAAFLKLAETYRTSDAILSSNAVLLATLLNADSAVKKLRVFTKESVIKESKNPNIFNHYVCLSASIIQDSSVVKNLVKNLVTFNVNEMVEDALCALYAKVNPLSLIKTYLLSEKNERHGLAIQTAVCIMYTKLPEAAFKPNLESITKAVNEKWKKDILVNILDKKYDFNYSLTSTTKVVTKVWDGVTVQPCPEGILIVTGNFSEFDEN